MENTEALAARQIPAEHHLPFCCAVGSELAIVKPWLWRKRTSRLCAGVVIYDKVGFGFHRYSTDARWLVPHFEKMLYDQALLAEAYLEAFQATAKEEYALTAREIFTYVLRDMTDAGGGFYSAKMR